MPPPPPHRRPNRIGLVSENRSFSQIMALNAAVERLSERDADAADVVRLRFFAGLSIDEVADALDLPARTVAREWHYGRAVLYKDLKHGDG